MSARPRRPPQRIRADRLKAQVTTTGTVLAPHRPRPRRPPIRAQEPQAEERAGRRLPARLLHPGRQRRRRHQHLPRREAPPPVQAPRREQGKMRRRPLHPRHRLAPPRQPRSQVRRPRPRLAPAQGRHRPPHPQPPEPAPRPPPRSRHHHHPRRLKPKTPADQARNPYRHGPLNHARIWWLILTVTSLHRLRFSTRCRVSESLAEKLLKHGG